MNTAIQGSIRRKVAQAAVSLLLVAPLGSPLVRTQWLGSVPAGRVDGVSHMTGDVRSVHMARGSRWSMYSR
jgi:hypothetical protein